MNAQYSWLFRNAWILSKMRDPNMNRYHWFLWITTVLMKKKQLKLDIQTANIVYKCISSSNRALHFPFTPDYKNPTNRCENLNSKLTYELFLRNKRKYTDGWNILCMWSTLKILCYIHRLIISIILRSSEDVKKNLNWQKKNKLQHKTK